MQVAFVTAHYAPFVGGVESHVEQIARRLVQAGDHVEVLTQAEDRRGSEEEIDGVHVRRFGVPLPSRHFAVAPGLLAELATKRQRRDVVHAHGYHSVAPLLSTIALAQPLVFTPHYHGTGHSAFRKALHPPYRLTGGRAILHAARHTVCVSEAERSLLLRHFPWVKHRSSVIPNGVDRSAIAIAEPMPAEGTVVLSSGRLEDYKHVDRTIEAVARLGKDVTLVVTGDGPARESLERLASERAIGQRTQFLGRVDTDELYRWFKRADVYVSCSTNEAMPVTILEVLAAGARVVASDIPAHRDIANRTKGPVTIVDPFGPIDALAEAIGEAAQVPRDFQADIPTWDEVTAQTRRVYEAVSAA